MYQAYSPAIAEPTLREQKFVPPFLLSRMTWIKPSFFWMMHRSGWATKPEQEIILAVDMLRSGFDWCVRHAVPALHSQAEGMKKEERRARLRNSCVRVQWDPERDRYLQPLPQRTIQLGLRGEATRRYAGE